MNFLLWYVKNRLAEDIWKNKIQKAKFFICENFTLRKICFKSEHTCYQLFIFGNLPIVPIPNHQEDPEYLICMGTYLLSHFCWSARCCQRVHFLWNKEIWLLPPIWTPQISFTGRWLTNYICFNAGKAGRHKETAIQPWVKPCPVPRLQKFI